MIANTPTWNPTYLAHLIQSGTIHQVLNPHLQEAILALTDDELAEKIGQTMRHPSTFSHPFWALVLAAQYYVLFETLDLPKALAVYEPGAGAEPPVVIASASLGGHQSRYTTMNLSNQPPAEREALGSPPEGGDLARKAPLGLLVD